MRKSLSKKTRFEVFKRDLFKCGYCGKEVGPGIILEIDHIIPVSQGGNNNMENLITSCFDCNRGKSKNLLSSVDKRTKISFDKASNLKEQKDQVLAFLEFQNSQKEIENQLCEQAIEPLMKSECYLPNGWAKSVLYFISNLGIAEVYSSAKISMETKRVWDNKKFTYFCGICHNKIKGLGRG